MGGFFSRDSNTTSNSNSRKTKNRSSIQEKRLTRTLWGRDYHTAEKSAYMFPKDDKETDRLHIQHFITKELLGFNIMKKAFDLLDFEKERLFVLDICCGPATWLCEESLEYPNCHFTGIDMYNLWPQDIRPVNLNFTEANVLNGLPYPDQSFHFIQMRFSEPFFKSDQWPFILSEINRILKDEGCFQWIDIDLRINASIDDTVTETFTKAFESFCALYHLNSSAGTKFANHLSNEKMNIVQTEYREIPLGWGGPVGDAYLQNFGDALEGLAPWLKESFNTEKEEDYRLHIHNIKSAFIRSKAFINLYAYLVKK